MATSFDFDDLLTRAAERPTRDVQVHLDASVSRRIADLEAELENVSDQRLGDSRPGQIQEQIDTLRAESVAALVTFRFQGLPGPDWSSLTARSPMRVDAVIDRNYGYNYHAVCMAAAPKSGGRLIGDTVEPLTDQQWAKLWPALSGHDFERVCSAIWEVNEYEPEQRALAATEEAKKDSRAGSAATSN